MRYPIILMDADETLFDFKRAEATAFTQTMQAIGAPYDEGARARYSAINDKLWRMYERGEITKPRLVEARFEEFLGEYAVAADPAQVNRAYLQVMSVCGFLLPGAEALCKRLHKGGHRLFIVTNGTTAAQKGRMAQSGLGQYFEGVFISDEIGANKPDTAFFSHVFAAIGNPPRQDIIILGDSLTSDMRGGRAAGISTCWLCPPGGQPNGDCDYAISRLEDFDAIVK